MIDGVLTHGGNNGNDMFQVHHGLWTKVSAICVYWILLCDPATYSNCETMREGKMWDEKSTSSFALSLYMYRVSQRRHEGDSGLRHDTQKEP
jgi:hypothetical protein